MFILCEGRGGVCRGSQLLIPKFLGDSIDFFYSVEDLKEETVGGEGEGERRESEGGSERHYFWEGGKKLFL
jgi:hypothetical protein